MNMGMSTEHRELLISNRVSLLKSLEITELFLASMRENQTINEEMEGEIKSKGTKAGQIIAFLDILPRRGPYAFDQFVKALADSDQVFIIDMLSLDPRPHYRDPYEIAKQIDNNEVELVDINYLEKKVSHQCRIHWESNQRYPREEDQRGRVVIINIEKFEESEDRNGSQFDVENLRTLFKFMKYDVAEITDKTLYKKEFYQILENEVHEMKEKHGNYFMWMMFIMTHGEGNNISTSDSSIPIDDILQKFDGNNCPGLISIPKVFFFQCCMGEKQSQGLSKFDCQVNSCSGNYEADATSKLLQSVPNTIALIHEKADFFLAFCSFDGYISWRAKRKGTWFVHAIAYIFSRFARHEDLSTMMIMVTDLVTNFKTDEDNIQQPMIKSSFKKKLYIL